MLRIALIGCGKHADAHIMPIRLIPGCEIVGVCDNEELMAKQLSERYNNMPYFGNVNELLSSTRPDIVHITAPPQAHLSLGTKCLEAGCHVFFEKPFTTNASEASNILCLAEKKNLKITVGHNNQFNLATRRMRELVQAGYLGGPPIHMESIWSYDLGDQRFASALLSDRRHWVRHLPGKLLHNIISHGIGKIAEFIENPNPRVLAHAHRSRLLMSMNEVDIVDELRVIIFDNNNTTAYFTFSTQIGPKQQRFCICGPKNSVVIDDMHQTVIKICRTDYLGHLNYFVPPLQYSKQYIKNCLLNAKRFLKKEFHLDAGRRFLIESFYEAIRHGSPLPLTHKEILLTANIMDEIFRQIY